MINRKTIDVSDNVMLAIIGHIFSKLTQTIKNPGIPCVSIM